MSATSLDIGIHLLKGTIHSKSPVINLFDTLNLCPIGYEWQRGYRYTLSPICLDTLWGLSLNNTQSPYTMFKLLPLYQAMIQYAPLFSFKPMSSTKSWLSVMSRTNNLPLISSGSASLLGTLIGGSLFMVFKRYSTSLS